MIDVMIDLETASSKMDAAILSIGAVRFDTTSKLDLLLIDRFAAEGGNPGQFYVNVDLQSCIDVGLQVSGSTFFWWLSQSEAARKTLQDPKPVAIGTALTLFKSWLAQDPQPKHVWAHANFDLSILDTAYSRVLGTNVPWRYVAARDVRTLYDIAGVSAPIAENVQPHINAHNALYDAACQAIGVQTCYERLKT